MICPKCGKEIEDGSRSCCFCGERQPEESGIEPGAWEKAAAEGKSLTREHFILIAVIVIVIRILFAISKGPIFG